MNKAVLDQAVFSIGEEAGFVWDGTQYVYVVAGPDGRPVLGDLDAMSVEEKVEKGRPRKFATREEAARYAAQVRWGNRTPDAGTGLSPQMEEMRLEAEALRAEVDAINAEVDFSNLQRTSPLSRSKQWTDDKGLMQINTANEELIPSPKVADLHDRVVSLGYKMEDEARRRTMAEVGDKWPTGEGVNEVYAKNLHAVVAEIRPVGGKVEADIVGRMTGDIGKPPTQTDAWAADAMNYAVGRMAAVMPTGWLDLTKGLGLEIRGTDEATNGYFRRDKRSSRWAGDKDQPEMVIPATAFSDRRKTDMVVAHEFTHVVQYAKPAVSALEHAFMTHRITGFDAPTLRSGQQQRPLRGRMTSVGAEGRVTGRLKGGGFVQLHQDTFADLYSGRRYDSPEKTRSPYYRQGTNRDEYRALEILTTGVEQFVSGNIQNFDKDHLSFTLGMLVST